MNLLTNTLAFAFVLGVIIFVHELGHLLVARFFNVRVLAFSLGFGKRLWGFKRGETDYRISLFPLGGYVKLSGEIPEEAQSDDPQDFMNKPRWQRILVYLAGPAMNFVLAIALMTGVFTVGIDVPNTRSLPPVIGAVLDDSPAAQAGLEPGDRILTIDGEEIRDWQQVIFKEMASPSKELALVYSRDGRTVETLLTPETVPRHEFGFAGFLAQGKVLVQRVMPNGAAAAAGFQADDQVVSIDGRQLISAQDFTEHVRERPGQEVEVEIFRGGEPMTLRVTPREQDGYGVVGVVLVPSFFQKYPPLQALQESVRYNLDFARQTFVVLGKIFSREMKAKTALSGPIDIAAISGSQARRGFGYLIHLMALISVSIGIVNLLPIPLLDGGQIVVLFIESVLRRDLSLAVKDRMAQVGLVLIMLLMVTVLIFDLQKNLPAGWLPGG